MLITHIKKFDQKQNKSISIKLINLKLVWWKVTDWLFNTIMYTLNTKDWLERIFLIIFVDKQ